MESKFVKARCTRHGFYYALEVKKFGSEWKVVNMTNLTAEEGALLATQVDQRAFKTNENLLPCPVCGTRTVGGCMCALRKCRCRRGMEYNFDCIYCKNFEIDRSLPSAGARAGGTLKLAQGQEVPIVGADSRPLSDIRVGVGWDPVRIGRSMDVDSSVVVLSRRTGANDLVYFGNRLHPSGCVVHHGDNLTGEDSGQGDDENIDVDLSKVPSDRDAVVFVINVYDAFDRHQNLSRVKNLYIKLYDPSGGTLMEYMVNDSKQFGSNTAIVLGAALRTEDGWTFRAIGRGLVVETVQELAGECKNYL